MKCNLMYKLRECVSVTGIECFVCVLLVFDICFSLFMCITYRQVIQRLFKILFDQ